MQQSFLLCILCCSLFLFFVSDGSSCEWSSRNATYDLHPLTLTSGGQSKYYLVHDEQLDENTNVNKNFTYAFNICEKVLQYPSTTCQDDTDGYCPEDCITNATCATECEVAITEKGYAYQMRTDDDGSEHCHHLASADSSDYGFSLLNPDDPAAGIVLTYYNGDFCSGVNREFSIRFQCENDEFNVPDNERVEEYETCRYNMTIPSIYGCPSECGIYSHALCGSQGLCGYDWSNNNARCFCYHQYSGNDCSEYTDDVLFPDTKDKPEDSDYVVTFEYDQTLTNAQGTNYNGTVNVTYDLSPFHLSSDEMFTVNDTDRNFFKYYFNVLDNIDEHLLPAACVNASAPCDLEQNPDCSDLGVVNKVGAAFQYNTQSNICNLVGTVDDYEFRLVDTEDPAKGVVLSYLNGGYCRDSLNRKFNISFVCPDSTRDYYSPDEERGFIEYVDESHDCEYDITIETALACPYECISDVYDEDDKVIDDEFGVCGGRGMCAADPSAGMVRCLCDEGWSGVDCNLETRYASNGIVDDHKAFQIAIAVISIVLIAVIGIAVYMRMRYKTLEKNLLRQALVDDAEEDSTNQAPIGGQLVKHEDTDDDEDDQSDAAVGDATQNRDDSTDNESDSLKGGNANTTGDLVVEDLDENDSD